MRRFLPFLLFAGCSGQDDADPPDREPRNPTREERPAWFTDAWDEADLVEVLETGAPREATLRDALPRPRLRSSGEAGAAAGPARAARARDARRGG